MTIPSLTAQGRFVAAAALLSACGLAAAEVSHPFLVWTKEEAAAIRRRLETDPLAKKQYERMVEIESAPGRGGNKSWLNLFKYSVLGDKAAGEAEKKALLGFIAARVPQNTPGNPEVGNASWREDRTLDAVRYDVLYDELTAEERAAIEKTARYFVEWCATNPGPWQRGDRGLKQGARMGWLPNMQWPTMAGAHVLAVAIQDRAAVERIFNANGGWKWYLDNYIADGRFYMEEFGKYYSNIGAMLLWCEGLRRLGWDQYGWGYTGTGGANMENFLNLLIYMGLPRLDRGAAMPDYPVVTMGDAGAPFVVEGYRPPETVGGKTQGGNETWWGQARMNGAIQKMHQALWWEAGQRRFPNAGYDYFLAQLRRPGDELYLPSLYFGLGPIDPKTVRPPAPKSFATRGRGFALLRADETPSYWEGPKPAVALQFGMYYVHYVHDCFCILNFVADNRMIYQRLGALTTNYAGGDPMRDHVRGQGSGVVVDSLQVQPVDNGEEGIKNQRLRCRFAPDAKFVAIRAKPFLAEQKDAAGQVTQAEKALYPGVDAERALVLTDEYLFDAFWLRSDRERQYDWHVNASGQLCGVSEAPWADSTDLAGGQFWDPRMTTAKGKPGPDPANVRKQDAGDAPWSATIVQRGAGVTAAGVRVSMWGEKGTALYGLTPAGCDARNAVTLLVRRHAPSAVFVAVHEPFKGGLDGYRIARFERLAQTAQGLAARVAGKDGSGVDDRILLRYGDDYDQPLTLAGEGESFTFRDCVHVRVGAEQVTVSGPLTAMKLRVRGAPKLVLNEKETPARVAGGVLEFEGR